MSADALGTGSRPASATATNANEAKVDQERGRDLLIAMLLSLGVKWLWDLGNPPMDTRRWVLDRLVVDASGRMVTLTRDLASGRITIRTWLVEMRQLITDVGIACAMALLGRYELNDSETSSWVSETNLQYGYLKRFYDQVKAGSQILNVGAIARADLYARALWSVAWRVYAASILAQSLDTHLKPYGIRQLGVADHCHGAPNGCVELSMLGWQPLEEVSPIGSSICGARCHCSIIVEWRTE